jgi:hypothetical protein
MTTPAASQSPLLRQIENENREIPSTHLVSTTSIGIVNTPPLWNFSSFTFFSLLNMALLELPPLASPWQQRSVIPTTAREPRSPFLRASESNKSCSLIPSRQIQDGIDVHSCGCHSESSTGQSTWWSSGKNRHGKTCIEEDRYLDVKCSLSSIFCVVQL